MISCQQLIFISVAGFLIMNYMKDNTHKLIAGLAVFWIFTTYFEGFDNGTGNGEGAANLNDGVPNNGFNGESGSNGDAIVGNNTVSSGGARPGQQRRGSYINTGPYDGLCLKTGNKEYWMKSPDQTSLVPNDGLYTYLSSQGPIKMRLSDQAALRGPPVDGVKGSPEKMFMWANNITSPLCCPSTFSTSTGCVCSTKNQRDFIAARGTMNIDPSQDVPNDEVEV